MSKRLVRALASLALTVACACDSGQPAAQPTPAPAPKAPEPAAGGDTGGAAANPHAANPHAANPHAANPHAANPHGMRAMTSPKPKAGPPRDVTPSGETTEVTLSELKLQVPKEWESTPPSSSMRMAQFNIPGPGGDAELVVFRFPGGAGGVTANIDRWKSQFSPNEGESVEDMASSTSFEVGQYKVTSVDIRGHYVASMQPGQPGNFDKPDHRMLGAIIEGSGDAFFLKGVGPAKTLAVWEEPFTSMLKSAK